MREHRLNTGRRPTEYYRQLNHLPGVVLVDAFDSQFKYIANADLVVTDNGSTGWEAVMLGRRVMTVAPHFFEGAAWIAACSTSTRSPQPSSKFWISPLSWIRALYDQKLGWLLDAEWDTTTPMQPIDTSEMFGLLQNVLNGTPIQQEKIRSRSSA